VHLAELLELERDLWLEERAGNLETAKKAAISSAIRAFTI
jgi:hypothetical protein